MATDHQILEKVPIPAIDFEQPDPVPEDTATTQAELLERKYGLQTDIVDGERPAKRLRPDDVAKDTSDPSQQHRKGVAPVKAEFLLSNSNGGPGVGGVDDDAAEAAGKVDARDRPKKEKTRGQNKGRNFGSSRDEKGLCNSRATYPELSPATCRFGNDCRMEHDLRKYLKDWKRPDLETFEGKCPVFAAKGWCSVGWKCRFSGSHSMERENEDGRKELVLLRQGAVDESKDDADVETSIINVISSEKRIEISKRKYPTVKTEKYLEWMNSAQENEGPFDQDYEEAQSNRAMYKEPPFLPSEKRRIYFGPETPALAPLTTQGNLPFRRLCVALGAQLTYSEMAMGMPLIQGHKPEWALMRAHEVETKAPRHEAKGIASDKYVPANDLRFGAQIAGNKPWVTMRTTEILSDVCSSLRVIDLNCGCPIDLVCKPGAGSSLLDNPSKLEKILRGMNAVSKEIPVTVKIRMGTRDNKPTAIKLVDRLVYGTQEAQSQGEPTSGVAAITLHGRSKQQRYTKRADWEYIASCAALINRHRENGNAMADTVGEADPRLGPSGDKTYFIGNGDCYSHFDYYEHLDKANVDGVMVGRGALIKPWIFEEIEKGQYLDKSASERLSYIDKFCRNGLDAWGSDEMGVGLTRRFLLEWLNFTHRYVPIGILEYLPPNLQDRAPAWKGRNELETLMASDNYKDWIKISEMFLGPAHKDFKFQPKHKSNSYDMEAEG